MSVRSEAQRVVRIALRLGADQATLVTSIVRGAFQPRECIVRLSHGPRVGLVRVANFYVADNEAILGERHGGRAWPNDRSIVDIYVPDDLPEYEPPPAFGGFATIAAWLHVPPDAADAVFTEIQMRRRSARAATRTKQERLAALRHMLITQAAETLIDSPDDPEHALERIFADHPQWLRDPAFHEDVASAMIERGGALNAALARVTHPIQDEVDLAIVRRVAGEISRSATESDEIPDTETLRAAAWDALRPYPPPIRAMQERLTRMAEEALAHGQYVVIEPAWVILGAYDMALPIAQVVSTRAEFAALSLLAPLRDGIDTRPWVTVSRMQARLAEHPLAEHADLIEPYPTEAALIGDLRLMYQGGSTTISVPYDVSAWTGETM